MNHFVLSYFKQLRVVLQRAKLTYMTVLLFDDAVTKVLRKKANICAAGNDNAIRLLLIDQPASMRRGVAATRVSMIPIVVRGLVRAFVMASIIYTLHGCYYMQAARGQLDVMRKSEPIADVVNSGQTPAALSERLRLVEDARQFSIDELGLPDNDSYRGYADIERDYVVWNVVAAPEFSLTPKRWCFPVAGCVNYRGYFSEQAARRKAARFEEQGYDVIVGGVPAYSTLGRFSDPVLNTMLRWDNVELVAMLFHELAHQALYIKGDSGFNESFATAVEEVGVKRWLASRGLEHELIAYRARSELRQGLMRLVGAARVDLNSYYSQSVDDDRKRILKQRRLNRLAQDVAIEFAKHGRDASIWLGAGLNNARLATMTLYEGRLPAFRALLHRCDDDLTCFYAEARRLSKLDVEERNLQLDDVAAIQDDM